MIPLKKNFVAILFLSSDFTYLSFCVQHGMTPLMQAAYKGNIDMCELLLAHGADVNSNFHEHQVSIQIFS